MELSFIIRFASAAVQACRDMGGFLPSVLIAMFCVETGYGKGSGCAALMLWFNLLGMTYSGAAISAYRGAAACVIC